MKKIYFLFLVFCFAASNAQIINFPDANFKARLLAADYSNNIAKYSTGYSMKIDVNNDSEIQLSELADVSYLDITSQSGFEISNLTGISNFINLIELKGNNNALTQIDLSNLTLLEKVELRYNLLTNINIQNCTSLETLILSNNSFTSLNLNSGSLKNLDLLNNSQLASLSVQNCPLITNFSISNTSLVTLNLSNLLSLYQVNIVNNNVLNSLNLSGSYNLYDATIRDHDVLTSIDLSNLNSLYDLDIISNNVLTNVNVNGCTNLYRAQISNNPILTNLVFENLPNLLMIYVWNNALQSITTTNLPMLSYLIVYNNQLSTLDLHTCQNLFWIDIENNNFTSFQLPNLLQLQKLYCGNNELSNIVTSNLPNLTDFQCANNYLTEIDVSQNNNLTTFFINNNMLTHILMKNGNNENLSFYFNFNPNLQFICTDSNYISDVHGILSMYGYYNVVVNTYCSFTPGGTFYTIQGNTKFDSNSNGCDTTDPAKSFQNFSVTNGSDTGNIIANSSGNYMISVQAGNHTITPVLENPTYFNISPTSVTASFPTQTSPLTQNFCISANGAHNDLEVVIVPVTAAAPGFISKYKVIYKNKGTHTQSGNLSLNYNDDLMDFNSATTTPVSQSSGLLNWNFSNLLPFETREITVTYTLNTPTATPPLNGGDILNFNSLIIGATDETPSDNNFALNQTVVNSFDPNDKTCLEGSSIATTKVGDYVHYLVRFENTGTANAQNIVVKDLIDTTKFDLSSLVALNGSHSFITRITNPNTVEFIFENIQLPFANATNDGYVLFKIKTKSTLVLGDSFSNTANIYFDYNAPIVTNTYSTSVQNSLATDETEISNEFSIFPNPVSDFVSFKSPERIQKIEIFDLSGRIICANAVQNNSSDLSILSKGNYIIKAYSKQKTYIKKLIKK